MLGWRSYCKVVLSFPTCVLWHHRENSTVNTFNVTIVSVPAKHQKKSWLCEPCTKYHAVKTDFHHESQTVAAIICFKHKRKELKFFKDKWPENTYWGMHVQWTVTVYQSNHMTTGHDYFFLYSGSSLQASCWTPQDWIGDATEKGAFKQTLNMVLDNPCLHFFGCVDDGWYTCFFWVHELSIVYKVVVTPLKLSLWLWPQNETHSILLATSGIKHTRMRIIQKNERKTSVQFRVS